MQPRTAKAKDKLYRLTDGGGLYLLVNPDGAKYWRMDYRLLNVRKTAAFGKYPQVSLSEAREKRKAARKLIDDGIDPVQAKKETARLAADSAAHNGMTGRARPTPPAFAHAFRALRQRQYRCIALAFGDPAA